VYNTFQVKLFAPVCTLLLQPANERYLSLVCQQELFRQIITQTLHGVMCLALLCANQSKEGHIVILQSDCNVTIVLPIQVTRVVSSAWRLHGTLP
jgi:hypothetical protein